jgi:hypothetical protein
MADALEQVVIPGVLLLGGPGSLLWLIFSRESERFARVRRDDGALILRASCARCGGWLVAAEILYVVDGELRCESCVAKEDDPALWRISDAELSELLRRARRHSKTPSY